MVLCGEFISLLATSGTSVLASSSVSSPMNVARSPKRHSCTDGKWLCNRKDQTFGSHAEDSLLGGAAMVCRTVSLLPDL